jgi:hypothetical protein
MDKYLQKRRRQGCDKRPKPYISVAIIIFRRTDEQKREQKRCARCQSYNEWVIHRVVIFCG